MKWTVSVLRFFPGEDCIVVLRSQTTEIDVLCVHEDSNACESYLVVTVCLLPVEQEMCVHVQSEQQYCELGQWDIHIQWTNITVHHETHL